MAQITLNSSGIASNGTLAIQTNGTTTAISIDASQATTIQGLTVGKGTGAVASNTVVGSAALASNTTGSGVTAIGFQVLYGNTTGVANTGIGGADGVNSIPAALTTNTTGSYNVAVGTGALKANTTATRNTAAGYQAGYFNTTGIANVFIGHQAGYANATSSSITLVGDAAGAALTGGSNTFIGQGAGQYITSGTQNTIIGRYGGNEGSLDIRTASGYIVLSDGAGNPRGYFGTGGNFVITRTTFSSLQAIGCYQDTTGSAANVFISSSGDFVRSTSSRKYKKDIETATHGLAELLTLRPVTYKGTGNHDSEQVLGGLIAEEVHEAGLTEFVQYAEDGSPDALAYGHMVSLCVKAIQELKAEFDAYKASHP